MVTPASTPESPAAVLVRSRADLATRLSTWPHNEGDMTWGLVVVGTVPNAGDLAALREAGKLCDAVVAVRLPEDAQLDVPLPPNFAQVIRAAGADIAWVPPALTGPVRVSLGVEQGVGGNPILSTLLVQAVTTVLPTLVLAHRANLQTVRAFRNVLAGLGDLYTLRLVG